MAEVQANMHPARHVFANYEAPMISTVGRPLRGHLVQDVIFHKAIEQWAANLF